MVRTVSTNFVVNLPIAAAAQSWSVSRYLSMVRFGEGLVEFSVNQKEKEVMDISLDNKFWYFVWFVWEKCFLIL